MRILFDKGTPQGVAAALREHVVEEARARGWDALRNGEFLRSKRNSRQRQPAAR
jgi:predicted GNAT family acetyltransferase